MHTGVRSRCMKTLFKMTFGECHAQKARIVRFDSVVDSRKTPNLAHTFDYSVQRLEVLVCTLHLCERETHLMMEFLFKL